MFFEERENLDTNGFANTPPKNPVGNMQVEDNFTEMNLSSPSTPRNQSVSPEPRNFSVVCPPTPLPTPNWVQRANGRRRGIARQNSLAATKTLLDIKAFNSPQEIRTKADCFLESFEIITKLGEGNFSEVFKVRCRSDGETYAVKKAKRLFRSKNDREVCLREARNFQALDISPARRPRQLNYLSPRNSDPDCMTASPLQSKVPLTIHDGINNIVRYYKAWQEEGFLYMQMELCEQGSIHDLLVNLSLPIPESQVWTWTHDIAMGLAHMHSRQIVHVDIKPENIMIGRGGVLKLGDLGLACQYIKSTKFCDSNNGDSRYLALETLRSPPSPASDIFSFGMTIYEIVSVSCGRMKPGGLPKDGKKWRALRHGHPNMHGLSCSLTMKQFISQLLQPHRSRRPQAAQILCHPKIVQSRAREISLPASPVKFDWSSLPSPFKDDPDNFKSERNAKPSSTVENMLANSDCDTYSPKRVLVADRLDSDSGRIRFKPPATNSFARRLDDSTVNIATPVPNAGSGGFRIPRRTDHLEESIPTLDDVRTTLF